MYTLGTHFSELLKNIRPPQERIAAAVELPGKVRDYLRDHEEFVTVSPHSRLAGSYAQDMTVGDVKDVDFLVKVPGDPEACDPTPRQVISDLKKTLEDLPGILDDEGCADIVECARRSVHVYFSEHDFHIDAVPCIAPDGFDAPLYVPDRGWNKWVPSHPIGFVTLLNHLNNEHGKKVKPLGKLLKHFRNVQMNSRKPKSYWLGALLVYHVQNELDMTKSLAELFHDYLSAIYTQYDHLLWTSTSATPNIADPMLGHNVSWNWNRSHFETFMRRIKEGRDWAKKALDAGDRDTAIGYWQRIFGEDYFPSEVEIAAKDVANTMPVGVGVVAGTGLITPTKPANGIYTSSLPTRFHGDGQS